MAFQVDIPVFMPNFVYQPMIRRTTNCKICDLPVTVSMIETFNQEQQNKWLTTACHNRCWDQRILRQRLEEAIQAQCRTAEICDDHAILSQIRQRIESLTKKWVENEAAACNSTYNYSTTLMVENIMFRPRDWYTAITETRQKIREKAQSNAEPADNEPF
jgi:hypothetical protein